MIQNITIKFIKLNFLSGFNKNKNFYVIAEDLENYYKLSQEEIMNKYLLFLFIFIISVSCVNNSYGPDVVKRSDAQKQQYVFLELL